MRTPEIWVPTHGPDTSALPELEDNLATCWQPPEPVSIRGRVPGRELGQEEQREGRKMASVGVLPRPFRLMELTELKRS